ncbi:head-tail connector protein [Shinella zoogloeoides]|uniref:head-tail connector protein n=1 Tax=Shinella zoogloeoides TaxID=352475 RepID=UPI001F573B3D|nr:phage head-tail connector protein [Shinella zoogloeoides]
MMTALSLAEAPAPAVTLADAKAFLHVWHSDDDALITNLIAAATDKLDGADGMLGRCIGRQKWKAAFDCFPFGVLKLPLPPLHAVTSIKYQDIVGSEQTLDPAAYRVSGIGGNGVIEPVGQWPHTYHCRAAVDVEFEAGYDPVPASIKHLILGLAFYWYENRGTAANSNLVGHDAPFGFDDALTQWRVPFVG